MNAPVAPSNVKLPSAVQAQVDAANKLLSDLNSTPAAPVTPTPGASRTPSAGHTSASGQQWHPVSTPAPAPSAPPPPAPAAAAAAAPPQVSDAERARIAEARYASLQGKYNSETALLREQVAQNTQLVSQLLERESRPVPASVPAAPQSPEDFLKSIGATDEDIKDYGELLPIVVRLAQNMYKPTIAKLENELAQLRNAASAQTANLAETRKANLLVALDMAVPQWRLINESDHFLDWLKVVDIFSGVTRHVALSSAYKNLDQARVVAIFEAYAREYPELARAPGAPVVDPVTLVAPDTRGDQPPAAPEGSGSKRIISESEIRDFYARVRKRQISKEEYARYQAEIATATAEGRVRPDRPDIHANSR
jgi:hypothetical protein